MPPRIKTTILSHGLKDRILTNIILGTLFPIVTIQQFSVLTFQKCITKNIFKLWNYGLLHYTVFTNAFFKTAWSMKMKASFLFHNVTNRLATPCHIPQDLNPQPHRCEKLISRNQNTIIWVTTVVRTWKLMQLKTSCLVTFQYSHQFII